MRIFKNGEKEKHVKVRRIKKEIILKMKIENDFV